MENVIEGNKLIAEFMGGKFKHTYAPEYVTFNPVTFGNMQGGYGCMVEELKFHYSWDWLMPVVEKIETGNYGFKMCRKVVEVYFDNSKEVILKTKEKCRMDSLWLAVVRFIQFYNTKTSKP